MSRNLKRSTYFKEIERKTIITNTIFLDGSTQQLKSRISSETMIGFPYCNYYKIILNVS